MKSIKTFLSVFMAVSMLVLSCTVGYADENDEYLESRVLYTNYTSGTYNYKHYSLDATLSSSTLIKSTGTYEETVNMTLTFRPTFAYINSLGSPATFQASDDITYGPHSTNSQTKSYTVSAAASHYYVYINGVYKLLSEIISQDAYFTKCSYKLKFGTTLIDGFTTAY